MKETVNTVQHRLPFLVYGILILMGKVKRHADQRINGGNQYPTKHVINILLAQNWRCYEVPDCVFEEIYHGVYSKHSLIYRKQCQLNTEKNQSTEITDSIYCQKRGLDNF